MSESSKKNDIVTEILDEAFNKDWDTFSPEEYKHQLAETQAEVKKLTPDKKPSVKNIVFHGLRHSYNQNREKRLEGDPRKLQKLSQGLGHRRLAVNDIYRE